MSCEMPCPFVKEGGLREWPCDLAVPFPINEIRDHLKQLPSYFFKKKKKDTSSLF